MHRRPYCWQPFCLGTLDLDGICAALKRVFWPPSHSRRSPRSGGTLLIFLSKRTRRWRLPATANTVPGGAGGGIRRRWAPSGKIQKSPGESQKGSFNHSTTMTPRRTGWRDGEASKIQQADPGTKLCMQFVLEIFFTRGVIIHAALVRVKFPLVKNKLQRHTIIVLFHFFSGS
jgi:hypothetical protein